MHEVEFGHVCFGEQWFVWVGDLYFLFCELEYFGIGYVGMVLVSGVASS